MKSSSGAREPQGRHVADEALMPGVRPALPPSDLVRAAQARLLARVATETAMDPAPVFECAEDRYDFGEPFAVGGLGVIRRAWDRRLGRVVAIKTLRRRDPGDERRFLLEAAITARLQHPAIVPLYDVGRFPTGEPYYGMKLVEGRSLEHVIRGMAALRERLTLLEHVLAAADAIAHAHTRGVIHRDLKPANILVGPHGETVVIDWGLAKDMTGELADETIASLVPAEVDGATGVGEIVGTLCYMPPEQAAGGVVDARSDVFALGAVLFHVLAGRAPHDGIDRGALLKRLRDGAIDEPHGLPGDVPAELESIVRKAMSVKANERYTGAEAFADDLRRFLTGRLVDAHRYRPRDLLRLWVRHHRAAAAIGAISLVLLAAGSIVFVVGLRGERDAAAAAQRNAEVAELLARRRAEEAVLAQARATLRIDLHESLRLVNEVDLSQESNLRGARLIALEADARGAPDIVLGGPDRPLEWIAGVAGGDVVGIDAVGEIWRWRSGTREGVPVAALSGSGGSVLAAAEAPVWVALASGRGLVFRGDEPPEAIDLAPLDASYPARTYQEHRWELSRHGETLAALGTNNHWMSQKLAGAYVWDLVAQPAARHVVPIDHIGSAALAPDGAVLAVLGEGRRTMLLAGEAVTLVPEISQPRRFTPSGGYLLGVARGSRGLAAWSIDDGTVRELGGVLLAVTPDDHVLVREVNPDILPLVHRPRLALRSIATGEDRWTADVDESKALARALFSGEGTFAVDERGERFALRLDEEWQIWSMVHGAIERVLDTGNHGPGVFLADGRFALARGDEVWIWESPATPVAPRSALALASDGSHAIVGSSDGTAPGLLRLADDHEFTVACLADFAFSDPSSRARGRVEVDRRGRVLARDVHGGVCLSPTAGEAARLDLPTMATAVALADEANDFAVGLDDGTLMAWDAPGASPRRWRLDSAITELWLTSDGAGSIALTHSEQVWAMRRDDETPTLLGAAPRARGTMPLRVAMQPGGAGALVALGTEEALVSYGARTGHVARHPAQLAGQSAIAYSASGNLVAAALGGDGVLVLPADLSGPGVQVSTREQICGVAFVDEGEIAALGESGALIRVDVGLRESAVVKRADSRPFPARLAALPSDELVVLDLDTLKFFPADRVPRDADGLRAWIADRTRWR